MTKGRGGYAVTATACRLDKRLFEVTALADNGYGDDSSDRSTQQGKTRR